MITSPWNQSNTEREEVLVVGTEKFTPLGFADSGLSGYNSEKRS